MKDLARITIAALLAVTVPATGDDISQDEIQALVRQLGHREYGKRVEAQRRLIELGPGVVDTLNKVARNEGGEIAIRAREIATGLARQLLAGVRVVLEGPTKPLGWNDPVQLVITMTNTSDHAARLPLFPERSDPARGSPEALAAARLIDLADFLKVMGPDDEEILLHVDDIKDLPELYEAVNLRLESEAVATLPPHRTRRIELVLNRGWARYAVLDEGLYHVQFVYTPPWEDKALRSAGVGVVASNRLTFHVDRAAPAGIRHATRPMAARLIQREETLFVELISTHPVELHVNTRLGPRLGREATLAWIVRWMDQAVEIKRSDERRESTKPHDEELRLLEPGQSLMIGKMTLAELFEAPAVRAITPGETFTIEARYSSELSRSLVTDGPAALRERIIPRGLTAAEFAARLPARVFTGVVATNAVEVTKPR